MIAYLNQKTASRGRSREFFCISQICKSGEADFRLSGHEIVIDFIDVRFFFCIGFRRLAEAGFYVFPESMIG